MARDLLQIHRGSVSDIPILTQGELGFTLDTEDLYIGGLSGNVLLNKKSDYLDIKKEFNVVGDGVVDDTSNFQAAIDYSSSNKKPILIPPNFNILVTSDIYATNNLEILGSGETSKITFVNCRFMSEKDNKRPYDYTQNYINDNLPIGAVDYDGISLTTQANKGTNVLTVNNTIGVTIGDIIHVFNNDLTTWSVLSDSGQVEKWNDPYNYPLGQTEIVKVIGITATTITINKQLLFDMPIGSTVRKNLGVSNVVLNNFKMVFSNGTSYGCRFEHINNSMFVNLVIDDGGINLMNKCYQNKIINCKFHAKTAPAILVYNFSTRNIVTDNTIQYDGGGDGAIIVVMSSSNLVSKNVINGGGTTPESDDGGIYIHARSYGNILENNSVVNCAPNYALYFGCFDNVIQNNMSVSSPTHYQAYYSAKNKISNNVGKGKARGNYYHRSLFAYYSDKLEVNNNIFDLPLNLSNCNYPIIKGNRIEHEVSTIANFGIWVTLPSPITEMVVNDNIIDSPFGQGIRIEKSVTEIVSDIPQSFIMNNRISALTDALYLKNIGYVTIKNNVFKNGDYGIKTAIENPFLTIKDNKFIDCNNGIDFANYNSTRHSNVINNVFENVPLPYVNYAIPSFTIAGGLYGHETYDLTVMPPTRKWVYNNVVSHETGASNWTEVILYTV